MGARFAGRSGAGSSIGRSWLRAGTLVTLLLTLPAGAFADAPRFPVERLADATWRLELPAELGDSWREVNLGRFRLRSPGKVVALDGPELPAGRRLELKPETAGCSLLELDAGPRAARQRSDAWQRVTRCLKIARCASGASRADRLRAGGVITARTGSQAEIRPLANPLTLAPGSDLPVKLYARGAARAGVVVQAAGPGDASARATSDAAGIATLSIPVAGLWRVAFTHGDVAAELIFEVADVE